MNFTISVITPSYNQGEYIEKTIQSVLNQGIRDVEYVVVDGGSRDETLTILKRYESRLRWVSEKDNGQADAINKGIRASSGEIVAYLNSDDVYYPGALAAVRRFFEKYPKTQVVYGDADHIDSNGNVIEAYYTEDWDYNRLKEVCFLCQPSVFFRRSVTERVGLFDMGLKYCMDYEYWLRLGAITPFVRLRKKLAGSRMYGENKTLGSRIAVHREINDMLRRRIGNVPERWIFNYAHAVVDQKGYDRTNALQEVPYVFSLVAVSVSAFFHWTHKVPPPAMFTMGKWLGASLKNMVRMKANENRI